MSDSQKPIDRINMQGSLEPTIRGLCREFGVGELTSFTIVEVGYEDCNVIVESRNGKFLTKIFSKLRTDADIERYVHIMSEVLKAGVNHPQLYKTKTGGYLHSQDGVSLVLMDFIEGKTFLELNTIPDSQERRAILEQATMINRISYQPPYLFDSWAIPNIRVMYGKVKQYIGAEDMRLVEKVIDEYLTLPVESLPHCFVHGDLTKANVLSGDDGRIYVLDFSVANWYPRIQELAIIIANLLHNNSDKRPLVQICEEVAKEYSGLNGLNNVEMQCLPTYTAAGIAMEFLGSHQEKHINGNDTKETDYWMELGRSGLRRAVE